MGSKLPDRTAIERCLEEALGGVDHPSPAPNTEEVTETTVELPDVCPNCGSPDRVVEPFVDENGTLTNLLTVLCTGCGYRLGDLPSLPLSAEAEDAEKSLATLPRYNPED
jgi:hypothetical protein